MPVRAGQTSLNTFPVFSAIPRRAEMVSLDVGKCLLEKCEIGWFTLNRQETGKKLRLERITGSRQPRKVKKLAYEHTVI